MGPATSEIEFIREPTNLNSNLQLQFAMTRANIALVQDNTAAAVRWLTGVLTESAPQTPGRTQPNFNSSPTFF
ncbi:MAG: hypothetical protein Ct9H300mP22_7580 [Gammaproteobacteria bacterium]|nr:MAG: hypothetical protein Ct9H300mP22_7580 [Gammaproteobacteria bacterium]